MKQYEIYLNNHLVGQATVAKLGLFTEFSCKCHFEIMGTYRVKVFFEDRELDLGICVPEGNRFVINTKIPSKHLGSGEPRFCAVDMQEDREEYTPIRVDEPFPLLSMLDKGRFIKKEACPGMVFNCVTPQEARLGK